LADENEVFGRRTAETFSSHPQTDFSPIAARGSQDADYTDGVKTNRGARRQDFQGQNQIQKKRKRNEVDLGNDSDSNSTHWPTQVDNRFEVEAIVGHRITDEVQPLLDHHR
jgi:hypothetical protein